MDNLFFMEIYMKVLRYALCSLKKKILKFTQNNSYMCASIETDAMTHHNSEHVSKICKHVSKMCKQNM